MSSPGYVELLGLLDEVDRVGRTQTLKISLEALTGPSPAPAASEPAGAAPPTMFDSIRTNDLLYEETQRLRNLLLDRLAEMQRAARPTAAIPASAPASSAPDAPSIPRSWTDEEI